MFGRIAILIFLLANLSGAAAMPPEMKIGAILSLSGDTANSGVACKNGIGMALSDLTPQLRQRLAVVIEDDGNQPRNTVSALNKLVTEDRIDAAIVYFSNPAKAVASIAESRRLTVIAIASDPEVVQNRSRIFNLWVTPEQEVRVLLDEARCRGYRRIARVCSTQAGVLSYKKVFDKTYDGNPEVVVDQEFPLDVKDFRTFIAKLKARNDLDAIFASLYFGQIGTFARQARELGLGQPLFAVEVFEEPAEVKSSGGALVGQ